MKIEYDNGYVEFDAPLSITVRGMQAKPKALTMPKAIEDALSNPIKSASLLSIARGKIQQKQDSSAIIVVSDNTRPVPYYGSDGLIFPIIQVLHQAGFLNRQISILIGAGSHRNMTGPEIEAMIGLDAMGLDEVKVLNHEYDQDHQLIDLGFTVAGSRVLINKAYYLADLKVVTGLVESHFMAGASGGRKGICPAIVGKETLTLFHGAKFLSSPKALDLNLLGNPLHEEATVVAAMAGCDFLVNVTLDSNKNVTGIFAGDLNMAHQAAVAKIKEYVTVSLSQKYDIVLIPAGFVGLNHYQAAKAAIEAARAVNREGKIIVVACNKDQDPIGGEGYKKALKLLHQQGYEQFMKNISANDWQIIQEQWQVQMWCKVFEVIKDPGNLYYCSLEIPESDYNYLPGRAAIRMLDEAERMSPPNQSVKLMIERSLAHAIETSKTATPQILLLKDGPYGVPVFGKE